MEPEGRYYFFSTVYYPSNVIANGYGDNQGVLYNSAMEPVIADDDGNDAYAYGRLNFRMGYQPHGDGPAWHYLRVSAKHAQYPWAGHVRYYSRPGVRLTSPAHQTLTNITHVPLSWLAGAVEGQLQEVWVDGARVSAGTAPP